MPTTCYSVFQNLLHALSLQEFPCGHGTWRNPKEQFADSQYSVTTKDYGAQYEKMDTLQEYLKSGPWDVDTRWSNEAAKLRDIAVTRPWELLSKSGKKFIHQFFTTLRIIGKQVSEVDQNMLLLKNLENLTLSVNLLTEVPSGNLPGKLKVLELCNNCIQSISSLCKDPPPLEHLGLSHNVLRSADEYKHFTVEYWPHLLSLDLSYNDLASLVGLTDRLASLPNLRNLVLQGNPLSLIAGYRGYTVDALRDLIILDDVHISADEKHHFKGLAKRREVVLEEARIVIAMETLAGVPMPEEVKEPPEPDQYPLVTTQYVVRYDMLGDVRGCEGADGTRESDATPQPHLEGGGQSNVIMEFETSGKQWEEEISVGYSKVHVIDDLIKFRDYLLKGVSLKVMSKVTRAWPVEPQTTSASVTPDRKKSGKGDTPNKKGKEAKTPTKPPKSGKGKKKPSTEPAMELRSDPSVFTEIGSHLIAMGSFLEGDFMVSDTFHVGGGPMMTEEEREKLLEEQQQLQQQMEDNKPDSKQSNKKGRTPSPKNKKKPASAKKTGSGKKKDKKADQEEKTEMKDLLPPKPITLQLKIELRRWKTAQDSLEE